MWPPRKGRQRKFDRGPRIRAGRWGCWKGIGLASPHQIGGDHGPRWLGAHEETIRLVPRNRRQNRWHLSRPSSSIRFPARFPWCGETWGPKVVVKISLPSSFLPPVAFGPASGKLAAFEALEGQGGAGVGPVPASRTAACGGCGYFRRGPRSQAACGRWRGEEGGKKTRAWENGGDA